MSRHDYRPGMATIDPFAPARLGPVTLRNRVIKAATFEGRTPRRVVTPELIEFHRRFAAGGVGMTTVAYCAITRAGTTDGHQIVLDDPDVGTGLRDPHRRRPCRRCRHRRADRPRGPGRESDGDEVAQRSRRRASSARSGCGARTRSRLRASPRSSSSTRTARGCCATPASTRSRCTSATATS